MHRFILPFSLVIYEQHLTSQEILLLSLSSKILFDVVVDCLYELPIIWSELASLKHFQCIKSFVKITKLIVISFHDTQFYAEDEERCQFFSRLHSLEIVNRDEIRLNSVTISQYAAGLFPTFNSLQYLRLQCLSLNSVGYSHLIESSPVLKSLNLNRCARLVTATITKSVESFIVNKCLELRNITIIEDSLLRHLSITNCPAFRDIKEVFKSSSSLQSCDFSGTLIEAESLEIAIFSCRHLSCLKANNCRKLSGSLLIESCSLVKISFQMCPLETLLVTCNAVLEIDLTLCLSLSSMYVSAKKLSMLKLPTLTNLVLLRLRCERLRRLDLGGCRHLFETNKIESLLAGLTMCMENSAPITPSSDVTVTLHGLKYFVIREAFFSEKSHSAKSFVLEMRSCSPLLDWNSFWRRGVAGCTTLQVLSEAATDFSGYDRFHDGDIRSERNRTLGTVTGADNNRIKDHRKPRSSSV